MRVAVFVNEFPALSETFVIDQLAGLIDAGHDVTIFAERRGNLKRLHPVVESYELLDRVVYLPNIPTDRLKRLLHALKTFIAHALVRNRRSGLLRTLNFVRFGLPAASLRLFLLAAPFASNRESYDIIYCHFGPNGRLAAMLKEAGLIDGALITVLHGYDATGYPKQMGFNPYRRLFRRGRLFLAVSNRLKERLLELGCPPELVLVHHMGVDCERFQYAPRRLEPGKPLRILTVARLVEKKGVENGIRAVAALREHGVNLRYDVVGEGPLRRTLEDLTTSLNADSYVTLHGAKSPTEVSTLLHRSQILLAPSVTGTDGDQEGIPVSLMEAMATGMPVISTEHGGIPELVEHNVSGLLAVEGDVAGLQAHISYLSKRQDLWQSLGNAARKRVKQDFNLHAQNTRLSEYLGILDREKPPEVPRRSVQR